MTLPPDYKLMKGLWKLEHLNNPTEQRRLVAVHDEQITRLQLKQQELETRLQEVESILADQVKSLAEVLITLETFL